MVIVLDNKKVALAINNHIHLRHSTTSKLLIKINVYQLFREQLNRFK